jgi:cytidyltransferase-like protein
MKIFVAGTFDHFHVGHQYLLWRMFNKCKKLIIIVARDKTVEEIKKNKPFNSEQKRLARIKKEFEAFKNSKTIKIKLGNKKADFIKTLKDYNPTHLYLGYDQYLDKEKIKNKFPNLKIKRVKSYLPEFFKSSKF